MSRLMPATIALLLTAGPASAQLDPMFLSHQYQANSFAMSNAMLSQSMSRGMAEGGRARGPQGAAQRSLRVIPDPMVAAAAREAIENRLVAAAAPANREALRASLRDADIPGAFQRLLQPYGYSPDDGGDVLTAWTLVAWQLVNATPDPSRLAIAAVRERMRQSLLRNRTYMALPSAERQTLMIQMAYDTVLSVARSRIPQRREETRAGLRQLFQAQGIDLAALAVTEQGFETRLS